MDDEALMRHLESHHRMAMEFKPEPDRAERRMRAPREWRIYHETIHRIEQQDHEESYMGATERIFYNPETGNAFISEEALQMHGDCDNVQPVTLYRPDLRPIYGGPTLLEALWGEMDRLMEALMTGATAEDGGDKFRAQATAWVIAITTNPYEPSVDAVRAEAMERWRAAEAEANAQEEALNPDEQEELA